MALDAVTLLHVLRRMQQVVIDAAAATPDYSLPERQYVTTGGAVYDCEQLTVSANAIAVGIAGADGNGQVANCGPGWNVIIELAIVRKACELPVGRRGQSPPTVDCIEADTAQSSADIAVLTAGVEAIAGPGWDQYGNVPASIQFGEVQGGLFAAVLTVTLNMWQIPELEELSVAAISGTGGIGM